MYILCVYVCTYLPLAGNIIYSNQFSRLGPDIVGPLTFFLDLTMHVTNRNVRLVI